MNLRVKPLKWELFWNQDKGRREMTVTPMHKVYHVNDGGWWEPLDVYHPCESMDVAKAEVQEKHAAEVLSCIELEVADVPAV